MSYEFIGLLGLVVLVLLLFARMGIAVAMAFVGFFGLLYLRGADIGLVVLGRIPTNTVAAYSMSAIPLFILMGAVVANTGVGSDLYNTAHKLVGHIRGGLAMATIVACGAFAAITGHSGATTATIGKVALPEMRKYNYDPKMATACIAAGGTIGILIPPSIVFIVYGVLTEQSIGKLFMAGIFPGILEVAFYMITVFILCRLNPKLGPPGPKTSFREKIVSLRFTWTVVVLFILVLGGIYLGVFTPTEAGAVGAFGAIVITFLSRRISGKALIGAIMETGEVTAMILFIMVGSYIFQNFMAMSKLPFVMGEFITQFSVSKYVILAIIMFLYIVLGCFLPPLAAVVLTIPIIFPAIIAMGFDPIWYGVLMVRVAEIGLITPPVGMNVFVLAGATNVPVGTIFRGVWPFVLSDILHVTLLIAIPPISLFLPSRML